MLRMRVKCDLKIRAELIKQVRSEDAVVVVSLEEDCVLLKGHVKDIFHVLADFKQRYQNNVPGTQWELSSEGFETDSSTSTSIQKREATRQGIPPPNPSACDPLTTLTSPVVFSQFELPLETLTNCLAEFSDILMRHSVIECTYGHVLPGYGNASVVGTCAQEGLEVQMQMQEIIKRNLPPAMKEACPIITYGHVAPLNEEEIRNSTGGKENTTSQPR